MNSNKEPKRYLNKVPNSDIKKRLDKHKLNNVKDRGDQIKPGTGNNKNIDELAKEKLMVIHVKDPSGDTMKLLTADAAKTEEIVNCGLKTNKSLKPSPEKIHGEIKNLRKDTKKQNDRTKAPEETNRGKATKPPLTKPSSKNVVTNDKALGEAKSKKSLKINIPDINRKKDKCKKVQKRSSETNSKGRQRISSPVLTKKTSPSTEISKWSSPKHGTQYYEAWVNYTGDARRSSFNKYLGHRREHQRHKSPELAAQNFLDERFTGRIKINYK